MLPHSTAGPNPAPPRRRSSSSTSSTAAETERRSQAPPRRSSSSTSSASSTYSTSSAAEMRHKAQLISKRVAIVCLYVVALLVLLLLALLYGVLVLPAKRVRRRLAGKEEDEVLTNDWWGLHAGDDFDAREKRRPKEVNMRKGVDLHTAYITTRDGVKLAMDIWIPSKALRERGSLPVVFHQARYYRSATLRWPLNLIVNGGKPISFINDPFFKSFLSYDMILVSVDVRGTGASFGTHPGPWSPEEQQDSMEVLDWIDRQPWSNGKVALWGASYEGTSAFFTSLLRHPTVVCCCPMFFFWDVFDDVSHPGGVPMKHFSHNWQGFNDALDSGWVQSTGWMARIFLEGVTPVTPEDSWGYQANQAIIGHKDNWSILKDDHIRYMDDTSKHTGRMVSSACVNQAVHELLAAKGITEAPPSQASPSTRAAKVLRSPSSERADHAETINQSGAELIEPAKERNQQNGPRERKTAAASVETPLTEPAQTEKGVVAEEDFLSGGANDTGVKVQANVPRGEREPAASEGIADVGGAGACSGAVIINGEDGVSLAAAAASDSATIGGGVSEGGEPTGGQGGSLGEGAGGTSAGRAGRLEETLPFYLHVSGWLDASAHAAVMAFMTLPCRGAELLVGPWNHGGHQHVRPHHITTRSKFDFRTEVSGFFVRCLSSKPEHLSRQGGSEPAGDCSPPDRTVSTAYPSSTPLTAPHTHSPDRVGAGGDDGSGGNRDEGCGGPSSNGYISLRSSDSKSPPCAGVGAVAEADGVPASRRSEEVRSTSPLHRNDAGHADAGSRSHYANVAGDAANGIGPSQSPTQSPKPNPDAAAAATAPLLTGAGARTQPVAGVAAMGVESRESEAVWKKARPRVRFFTHQEEQWHETNTFPSISANKDDFVLFLGKRLPPTHPQPSTSTGSPSYHRAGSSSSSSSSANAAAADSTTTSGDSTLKTYSTADKHLETDFTADRHLGDKPCTAVSEPCTAVSGVNCPGPGVVQTSTAGDGPHDHRGGGARTGSTAGRHATGGEEWDGDTIDEHVEDESDVDEEVDGCGAGVQTISSPDKAGSAAGGSMESGADPAQPRGVGMRKRLSSRLANWRKPKLTLSQYSHGQEELHELAVDLENDRDGEGVSRWAAMTEFLSLISYQMDGLRSNHLRFTSPPLKQDMEVTGYPVVSLWVSAADDLANLDVFVYLQAVKPRTGLSIYVTEGCFRAEHRHEDDRRRPIDVRALPGVPIHSYRRADAQPLEEGRPVELKFKLMPTSFKFLKGQRVRLSIGGADARHFHPIIRSLPDHPDPNPCLEGGDGISTEPHVNSRRAVPAVAEANVAGAGQGASLTRRTLRVHTGGAYASGVSLPVPRRDGEGSEQPKKVVGEEARGRNLAGRAAGIDNEGGRVDCQGARDNVAPPRTESAARNLRERRPCSQPNSNSGFLAAEAAGNDNGPDTGNEAPQPRGWRDVGAHVRRRSEGWLPLTETTSDKGDSRMFEDW